MGTLTSVQLVRYENGVKHAYQSGGSNLDATVRVKPAPQPGTFEFRKFGILDMIPRGDFRSVLESLAANHEMVPCTVSPFVLPIATDEFEQAGSGGEAPLEQPESATACGFAMRRQRDYSVISALEAGAPSVTVTAGAGLTVLKLAEILIPFDKYEMRSVSGSATGDSQVTTLITEKGHNNLLADAVTQNINTSNFKSLVDGMVEQFCGHRLILIGTGRGSRGLGITDTTRRCYSYVKSALGQAVSIEPQIEYGREILMTSDILMGKLMVGSVLVDVLGAVKTNVTES